MPRQISEKCRQCSKLSAEEAKQKDCWEGDPCHQRRYNYRNREKRNYDRRSGRSQVKQVETPLISGVAPVVIYWRESKESPVHAIGAELQLGTKCVLSAVPRHCLGATESDIHNWLRVVLENFRQEYGKPIGKFVRQGIELHPSCCPICGSQCSSN